MSRHVPYLTEDAIECDALALLEEFAHARGIVVEPPIPIEDIVEKHLKLRLEFDDLHALHNLPRPEHGQTDILGAIYGDGSIYIDESLDPEENPEKESRYRFTLAHELGHFRHHRHLLEDETLIIGADSESEQPHLCGVEESPDLKRAEWQANRYAACLLVPLPQLLLEWFNWRKSLQPFVFEEFGNDIRWWRHSERSDARLFRDCGLRPNREIHHFAFNKIASDIAPIFAVSTQMMRIRLEALGLLTVGNEIETPRLKFDALNVCAYEKAARDRVAKFGRVICR